MGATTCAVVDFDSTDSGNELGHIVPKARNTIPKAGNIIPKSGNIILKIGNMIPKFENIIPKIGKIIPKTGILFPNREYYSKSRKIVLYKLYILAHECCRGLRDKNLRGMRIALLGPRIRRTLYKAEKKKVNFPNFFLTFS